MRLVHHIGELRSIGAASLLALTSGLSAQTITYQGVLNDRDAPAEGPYEMKFQFRQPGPPPILFEPPIFLQIPVIGGRFTAPLDMKGIPVEEPAPLELVICVRRSGEPNWIQLDPPQRVTPAPRALAAQTANNIPASALPPNVPLTDDPPTFTVPVEMVQLSLSGSNGNIQFGPRGECSIGIEPDLMGLNERDPFGFRLLGQNNQGCRLIFGPTMDCTVVVDPKGPARLLLRDPRGIRILNPDEGGQPALAFGPTKECRIRVGPLAQTQEIGMIFEDPRGFSFEGGPVFGEFIGRSSRSLKENIKPLEGALEKIEKLQGVSFDWKPEQGGKPAIGFIAEDVGKVVPEVVHFEEDGVDATGVNYGHLVAVTVEGIKAQQDQIRQLAKENNELKDSLEAMKAQMERLAAQVAALNMQ